MTGFHACELLRRCLEEDSGGDWREFVDHHGWRLRNAVRFAAKRYDLKLLKADLDELVQDLYCRLLASRDQRFHGHSEDELWKYLARVSQSLIVDRQRSRSTRKRRVDPEEERTEPGVQRRRFDVPTPEERLLQKERRWVFYQRCVEVARGDRVVLKARALGMALLEGWPSRDIARRLGGGLSPAQIDDLVHRLRRHLAREGIEVPHRYCVPVPRPST